MRPLSVIYTPMYRICRLLQLFGIKESRLWVKDLLNQPDTLGWEDCYFRAENETKPTVNCSSCNVSIICEDYVIYSNTSRCVTRSEGDNDVEYCYENDEANTTEALEQCAQHSSMLMDIAKTDVLIDNKLHDIIRFYQESWVDIKQEDVR
ncbi:hypothetical protein MRX96_023223 [Rhipicephalus microplus]